MKRSSRPPRAHEVKQLSPEERALRAHDEKVFKIEKGILRELAPIQRKVLDTAKRLIAARLAPVDRAAAKGLMRGIRVRDLP